MRFERAFSVSFVDSRQALGFMRATPCSPSFSQLQRKCQSPILYHGDLTEKAHRGLLLGMRNPEKIISQRIHRLLKEKELSPYTLSQRAEIASGYLTELLNLHPKRRWNTDLLNKVADALDVPMWHLLVDPKEVLPPEYLEWRAQYEALDPDNKRIVSAMLRAASVPASTDAPPAHKQASKKR